jgi:hypothetical protein
LHRARRDTPRAPSGAATNESKIRGETVVTATFLKSLLGLALAAAALPALSTPLPARPGVAMPAGLRTALAGALAHRGAPALPLGIDWIEQEVTGSDGLAADAFGFSVAIDGDTALIGAAQGAAAGTGTDNGGAGAVYVFQNTDTGWTEVQKLTADDGLDNDQFGYSVALRGPTAIVGAAFANSHQGAVYVFTRTVDTWAQAQKLVADDGAADDQLGWSVALDGDTALLGAPGTTIDDGFATGAVYVFTRDGDTFAQTAKLTADDGVAADDFGFGVAINGSTAIISSANAGGGQGKAYVFEADAGSWTQETTLTADDGAATDTFGYAVAFDGTSVIGAPFATVGDNVFQGAAYTFTQSGGTWGQDQKLFSATGVTFDVFGISISMSGGDVVITAPFYNGSQGEAFLFSNKGNGYLEQHTFTASDAVEGQGAAFGYSGAVSNGTVLIGSVFNFVGNNEKQGAAYFYSKAPSDVIFENGFD